MSEKEAARPGEALPPGRPSFEVEEKRAAARALVRELLARLEREDVRELSVTKGDLRVRVRKDGARPARPHASVEEESTSLDEEAVASEPTRAPAVVEVKAPLTGLFYRAASPQAPPYVQVGSAVSVGQVVGLIEAMKLFNEIRSTAAGRVRRILADSGQLVRAHQPLLEVEPL